VLVRTAKVKAALNRHPDTTGRRTGLVVIGGEGQARDLDLIRTRQGLTMTLSTDSQRAGWATVDSLNSAFNGEEPRPAGFGGMLIDRNHNLPPSGPVEHNVNFTNVYRKAWGVG
jgi:ribose transport system substrate-binding protein